MPPLPPRDRQGFEVAIICALPLEAELVQAVFDKFWEDEGREYGKERGDWNTYTTGVIGEYNVVLAHMPSMGKVNSASVAASLRISYPGVRIALVVGICGGFPTNHNGQEIILGDVILSQKLVQYDFGQQYPNSFERKNTGGNVQPGIGSILAKIQTAHDHMKLEQDANVYLKSLMETNSKARYFGTDKDHLYQSSYMHKHHLLSRDQTLNCVCKADGEICSEAHSKSCSELGCDQTKLVHRQRLSDTTVKPVIHLGTIGSADTVMKSGELRDRIANADQIIGFEMEGAGVWDYFPSLIIKGVCDYADSHKNKDFQGYAAATAACYMKALLKRWTPEDKKDSPANSNDVIWHVPFDELRDLVGREKEIEEIKFKLFEAKGRRRVAVCGLGGIGKSRIAREIASYARERHLSYSVFWILASSVATFERDFLEVGKKLKIPGVADERGKLDRNQLIKQYLEQEFAGNWLLILDSADDELMWCRSTGGVCDKSFLYNYIPKNTKGSLLITTRNRRIASTLAGKDIINLQQLHPEQAVETLQSLLTDAGNMDEYQANQTEMMLDLVNRLSCLPLAIVQAAAYMNMNDVSIQDYLGLLRSNQENEIIQLLSEHFEDETRYDNYVQNAVASTWMISFEQINLHHPQAMEYLSFMSCLDEKNIPQSLLPQLSSEQARVKCVGILTGYSFIQRQSQGTFKDSLYSMHRLVRLAMRNWLRKDGALRDRTLVVILQIANLLPTPEYANWSLWGLSSPHVQILCSSDCGQDVAAQYDLVRKLGCYLLGQCRDKEALDLLARDAAWREEHLGTSHKETLESYEILGSALTGLGHWTEAEKFLKRAHEGFMNLLGDKYVDTTNSMDHLAWVYIQQGRYDEAIRLGVEVFKTHARTHGAEHFMTLKVRGILAFAYQCQGRFDQAERLIVEVLEMAKAIGYTEHPDILEGRAGLAMIYYDQGRQEEAEKLTAEVLKIKQRVLGDEHPKTLACVSNLGMIYRDQGRHEEAERQIANVIKIEKRLLGDEHAHTLVSMCNLAMLYRDQGRYEEAEQLAAEVLEIQKTELGDVHPDTLTSIGNLAMIYGNQGRYEEVEQLVAELLEIEKRVFGEEHPDTRQCAKWLTGWHDNMRTEVKKESLTMMLQKTRLKRADDGKIAIHSALNGTGSLHPVP